jgi:ABC-type uncharacterized transport system permease subunit
MLIGGIVISLALVGDRTAAGARNAGAEPSWTAAPGGVTATGLALAIHAYGTARRTAVSFVSGTSESLLLLALGTALIGAGRLLGRRRQDRRNESLSSGATAGMTAAVLRPLRPRAKPMSQEAAR